jgi:hypothetical protein
MRGYREPLSVPARPDIGIAAVPLLAIRRGVAGARVNDRDIAEDADFDVLRREAADRDRSSGLCQELLLVDQRPVRVRTQEVVGQDLIEPPDIAMLHGMDVIAVERSQRIKVASCDSMELQMRVGDPARMLDPTTVTSQGIEPFLPERSTSTGPEHEEIDKLGHGRI